MENTIFTTFVLGAVKCSCSEKNKPQHQRPGTASVWIFNKHTPAGFSVCTVRCSCLWSSLKGFLVSSAKWIQLYHTGFRIQLIKRNMCCCTGSWSLSTLSYKYNKQVCIDIIITVKVKTNGKFLATARSSKKKKYIYKCDCKQLFIQLLQCRPVLIRKCILTYSNLA